MIHIIISEYYFYISSNMSIINYRRVEHNPIDSKSSFMKVVIYVDIKINNKFSYNDGKKLLKEDFMLRVGLPLEDQQITYVTNETQGKFYNIYHYKFSVPIEVLYNSWFDIVFKKYEF